MTDTAKLVISVDSRDVKAADKALEGLEKQGKRTERATDSLKNSFTRLAGPLAIAGVAGVAAVAASVKSAVNQMDQLSKSAQKIGVTTEALSALQYAAGLADVGVGELQMGMTMLIKSQQEVASGSKKAQQVFAALGIEVSEASGKLRNADDVLADVADAFADMEDGAGKTAIAVEIFGRSGANMIPLLNGGAKGLREAADEARDFGLIVSTEAGRAAEQFNDNLTRMGAAVRGAGMELAVQLLPALNEVSDSVVQMARDPAFQGDLANAITTIGNAALAAVRGITAMANGLGYLYDEAREFAGLIDADDIERNYARLAKLKGQLAAAEVGNAGETLFAKQLRAEIATIESNIAAQEKLVLARSRASGLEEIDTGAIPGRQRKAAPTMGGTEEAKKVGTGYLNAVMAQNDDLMRGIMDQYYEQLRAFEDVQRIKFDLMDEEGQALAILQSKYIELDNAVSLGAISQGEAGSIRAELAEQWAKEQEEATRSAVDSLYQGLLTEEEYIRESYERRKEQILESTQATEEEKQDLLRRLEEAHSENLAAIDQDRMNERLSQASYYTGALASLMQSGNSKLFAIGKAAAIAQATIDGYQAVQNALAEVPYPFNIAAAAAMAVQTGVQIAGISSTNFSGAYDNGGMIPAGKWGIAGERGPEIIQGPAHVTSRKDTAELLGGSNVNVKVVPVFNAEDAANMLASSPAMERVIIHHVTRNKRRLGM